LATLPFAFDLLFCHLSNALADVTGPLIFITPGQSQRELGIKSIRPTALSII